MSNDHYTSLVLHVIINEIVYFLSVLISPGKPYFATVNVYNYQCVEINFVVPLKLWMEQDLI